jgi:hypothetical protein
MYMGVPIACHFWVINQLELRWGSKCTLGRVRRRKKTRGSEPVSSKRRVT